ncbi:MAG: SulP family inorganic anion transporter, partial [Aphanocapsa feldmannii 288cV]
MVSFKPVHGLHFRNVKGDFFGGITAAVVALPLALAFGNAALGEGGAIYGLYGAVIVGFFAALFGGTPSQVSGPTGPMSVTVAGVMASLAAVGVNQSLASGEALPLVMAAVVVGGLFQILFGVLRLGRYVTLVPYSVISGFMSGIGVIILLIQVGPFLGISTKGGVVDSLSMLFANFTPNWAAAGIGVMTLGIVFLTPKRISRAVPSPLLALLIVTPISVLAFGQGDIIPRVGDIPEGGLQFSMPNFGNHLPTVIQAGLVLAVL